MKFFIVSLVILSSVFILCAWGSHESVRRIDNMLETLSIESGTDGKIPENAAKAAEDFSKEWEDNMFLISMLLPHHHLDEVKEKLVSLQAYADTDEFAEWHEALVILREELTHIRDLIKVTADNVL